MRTLAWESPGSSSDLEIAPPACGLVRNDMLIEDYSVNEWGGSAEPPQHIYHITGPICRQEVFV